MNEVVMGSKGPGKVGGGPGDALLHPPMPARHPAPVTGCHLAALAQGDAEKGGRNLENPPYFCPNCFGRGEMCRGRRAGSAQPRTPHGSSFVAGKLGKNLRILGGV